MRSHANAVVSLLDPASGEKVRGVWSGIEHRLGLRGVQIMPHPHVTYHVAGAYDRPRLEASLTRFADSTAPFEMRTAGIGTFGPPWPVVYIDVAKDLGLRTLHGLVWNMAEAHATGSSELYSPPRWTPHISLAYGDEAKGEPLTDLEVQQVKQLLGKGEYRWTLPIDNFALVLDHGNVQSPVRTFPLRGE